MLQHLMVLMQVQEKALMIGVANPQNIYNADYNFAQPPFTPTLTAVPGDSGMPFTRR